MYLKGAAAGRHSRLQPCPWVAVARWKQCWFVLTQHSGLAAAPWGSVWLGGLCVALEQPLVATLGAAVLAVGAASAPAGVEGPWRGRPCRVALLLLKDCCFFSRLTYKAKTDTQFKHGPQKAFHFCSSKAKCLLRNVLA